MNKLVIYIFAVFVYFEAVSAVKSGRVIGGGDAKIADFPWQAAIYYDNIYICAGSLISEKHVLTTKNCLEIYELFPHLLNVHLGVIVAGDIKNAVSGIKIYLADLTPVVMDVVAILQMEKAVEIGTEMRAIRTNQNEILLHLDDVKLSGWGLEDDTISYYLQQVDLNIQARSSFCSVDGTKDLCTFGLDLENFNRVGPCKWDEGTALVKVERATGENVVIGVVKHVNQCSATVVQESKYIPLKPFITWIDETINNNY